MSRGWKILLGTLVLLVVLLGAAFAVDRYLVAQTEAQLEDEITTSVPELSGDIDVEIGGLLFLPQVLMGRLDDVRFTSASATYQDLTFQDVDVRLLGVSTGEPRTIDDLDLRMTLPVETLQAALASSEDVPEGVGIDVVDGQLVATASLLGLPVTVGLEPVANGNAISVTPVSFSIGGASVAAEDIPGNLLGDLGGMDVPIEQLPEGVELTEVTVVDGGVQVAIVGSDLALDDLAVG
ncbi:DUF2993 domain-containing protein [Occultella glacieicola]|uniref:DUF2993 domain-containing protein n=1 Tax=Occultella glacieicola TaxID=2518684 RepID=A0ABY2E8X8_9MICO|nr:DUF2993 domain-containing protein [Occultella glacieicola]TDE98960.1 DUF2993 domain-containing protein [Occultella glacieicola]